MIALVVGLVFVAFGLAGVRYAPTIVTVQEKQEMGLFGADELEAAERVRVTKGTGIVVALVGIGLVVYGVHIG